MKFELTILGSGSAVPTSNRNSAAQVLNVLERYFLIDCAEGTQHQLRRFHIPYNKINHIFISHLHGDHYFGLIGLLSTLSLQGRRGEMHVYGDARLKANPDYKAPKVAILPTDTPLRLLSVRGAWLKVSCTTKTGRNVSGWLPPECVWANPYRHEWR